MTASSVTTTSWPIPYNSPNKAGGTGRRQHPALAGGAVPEGAARRSGASSRPSTSPRTGEWERAVPRRSRSPEYACCRPTSWRRTPTPSSSPSTSRRSRAAGRRTSSSSSPRRTTRQRRVESTRDVATRGGAVAGASPTAPDPGCCWRPRSLVITVLFIGALLFGVLQSLSYLPLIGEPDPEPGRLHQHLRRPGILGVARAQPADRVPLHGHLGCAGGRRRPCSSSAPSAAGAAITFVYQFNLPIPHIVGGVGDAPAALAERPVLALAYALGLTDAPADFPALTNDRRGLRDHRRVRLEGDRLHRRRRARRPGRRRGRVRGLARTLGAGCWKRFWHVIVPLIMPAVLVHVDHRLRVQLRLLRDPIPARPAVPRGPAGARLQLRTRDVDLDSRPEAMAISVVIAGVVAVLVVRLHAGSAGATCGRTHEPAAGRGPDTGIAMPPTGSTSRTRPNPVPGPRPRKRHVGRGLALGAHGLPPAPALRAAHLLVGQPALVLPAALPRRALRPSVVLDPLRPRSEVIHGLVTSLIIATAVAVIAAFIGLSGGRALGLHRFRGKRLVELTCSPRSSCPRSRSPWASRSSSSALGLANTHPGRRPRPPRPHDPYVVLVMGAVFANYDTSYEDQAQRARCRTLSGSSSM